MSICVLFAKLDGSFLTDCCTFCLWIQDMAKVSYHFVRGKDPKKFASTLVNFMSKVRDAILLKN